MSEGLVDASAAEHDGHDEQQSARHDQTASHLVGGSHHGSNHRQQAPASPRSDHHRHSRPNGPGTGPEPYDERGDAQEDKGTDQPLATRPQGLDHVVVDVVAQRVGDGEQEAVGGGERRSETAGRDQA